MKTLLTLATLATIFLLPIPMSLAQEATDAAKKDVVKTIVKELPKKGFNTLTIALAKTDLREKLTTGNYTLIAPTDNAFRDIPKAQLDALLADKEKLTAVLNNHIVEGRLTTADLKSAKPQTLAGNVLNVTVVDGKVKINSGTIVRADIPATNGIIQGIDKLLIP